MVDMPDVSPQYASVVVIAQASQAQKGDAKTDRTIGVCQLIENPPIPPETAVNTLDPTLSAWTYLKRQERPTPGWPTTDAYNAARVSIVRGPAHGAVKDEGSGGYRYAPTSNYYGQDSATLLVEIGELKVKLIYFFKVLHGVGGGDQDPYKDKENCPKGEMWRISLNPEDSIGGLISLQHLK